MLKNIFIYIYILLACPLAAQDVMVQVLDKTNFQPIVGATVSFQSDSAQAKGAITDAKGFVSVPKGNKISLKALGYQPVERTFEALSQNPRILLTEALNTLDEVVVSASRFEEKRRDIAQQIQVINRKEMAFMNQGNLADVLQQSGQVLVQKSQLGGGSPILRGFEANKVLMVVDGIRMNNAIYRGGHLQNVITIDQAMLDKTEIVFGPGSVMYGSDALGGVMHFHTRKPVFGKTTGQAYLRYGSAASELTTHFNWNVASKRIAWVGGITRSLFGDLQTGNMRNDAYGDWGKRFKFAERIDDKDVETPQDNTNLQTGSGYDQTDFLQKLAIKYSKNVTHTINLQYSTSSNINRYDRLSEVQAGKLRWAEWYYGPQKRLLVASHLDWENLGFADLAKLTLAYQDIEESRHDRRFNATDINRRTETVKAYTASLDFTKQIKESEIRYGLDFAYNDVFSNAFKENVSTGVQSSQTTRYPNGGSKMRTFASYVSHTWEISPKFITTQGLRYNSVRLKAKFNESTVFPFPFDAASQNSEALNGNIGLIFMPTGAWRFALSGSTGFRAPNVDDLAKVFENTATGNANTLGTLSVPNSNIKPEITRNLELSVRNKFFQMLTVELIGYNTWYENALVVQPFTLNGQSVVTFNGFPANVVANQNARKAYIRGIYLNVVADLNEYVSFVSNLSYTYARIQDDTQGEIPLDHIPPMFGKSGFRINAKRVQTEIFALYNGAKRLQNYATFTGNEDNLSYAVAGVGTPAWATFNIRTAYQCTNAIQVQASLENIFDQHYRVFASGISGAGRNFIMTVRGSF